MSISQIPTRVPFLDLKTQYAAIRDEILDAIGQVLDSSQYVGGQWVERFEEQFASYAGAKFAVATGNGTAALELVLRAWGLGPGDEVVVPANTFFATAEAVSLVGATPVFADVDPETMHLTAASIERCLTSRTKAIIPVHLFGRAMDLAEIEQLAADRGLYLLEDACQASGARLRGVPVGGSGRPACFSFYPGKNLGAYGDGGAITCDDPALAQMLRILREHGSPKKYQHVAVGTNSRLDAVQAAILSVKLAYLDGWNLSRTLHADAYLSGLSASMMPGLRLPAPATVGSHNYHLFVVRSANRDALRTYLTGRGIETGIHYPTPLHLTPAYQALGYPGPGTLPVAERLAEEIVSLPMYPELTGAHIREVVAALQDFAAMQLDLVGALPKAYPQKRATAA